VRELAVAAREILLAAGHPPSLPASGVPNIDALGAVQRATRLHGLRQEIPHPRRGFAVLIVLRGDEGPEGDAEVSGDVVQLAADLGGRGFVPTFLADLALVAEDDDALPLRVQRL